LYEKAEAVCESYEEDIADLKSDLSEAEKELADAKEEIDDLEDRVSELESVSVEVFSLSGVNDNIVTRSVIENLFNNLDRIPLAKLEKLINQYA
jgi:chromosome segregation ATPase